MSYHYYKGRGGSWDERRWLARRRSTSHGVSFERNMYLSVRFVRRTITTSNRS